MRLLWTKRGLKRLQSAFDYIADNFYLDYAIRFDSDARNVAASLPANPQLGREAFPELDRPEIRNSLRPLQLLDLLPRAKTHDRNPLRATHAYEHPHAETTVGALSFRCPLPLSTGP